MTPPFGRVVCDCEECTDCCRHQPGPMVPGDMHRIVTFLGRDLSTPTARELFVASPGALLARPNGETYQVGTITPRADATGRCAFLTPDDRCSIHEVSPFGCAYFDTHMPPWEANRRSAWAVRKQMEPGYQLVRSLLPLASHRKWR